MVVSQLRSLHIYRFAQPYHLDKVHKCRFRCTHIFKVHLHVTVAGTACIQCYVPDGAGGHALTHIGAVAAGLKQVQLRRVVRGSETVLADAAAADELFLSEDYQTRYDPFDADSVPHGFPLRGLY